MFSNLRRLLRISAATLVLPGALVAQEVPSDSLLTVGHYLDLESVGEPKLSPDGARVVYTRRWANKMDDTWETALWITNADGTRNHFLTKGSNAVWSPDGSRIAYIAPGDPKGTQIFVRWMDSEGATSQVTRLTDAPSDLKWSPDGKWLGFSGFVAKPSVWKIDLPSAPEGAKWTKAPRYVDRLHYRQDRRGYTDPGFVHLFTIPADGGTPRDVTPGDWSVGGRFYGLAGAVGWAWTPDGRSIVVDGLKEADADLRYRESNLYVIDLATGAERRLTGTKGFWGSPSVSPDGQVVAFSGFAWTTDTYHASDLYTIRLDGTGMKSLSAGFDRSPGELSWAPDGSGVYFTSEDRGAMNLNFASVGGGVRGITTGVHMLAGVSLGATGIGTAVRTTFTQPTNIVRFALPRRAGETVSTFTSLTHVNDDVLAGKRVADAEEIWYRSTGGARVQGWIVKPPSFDPAKKYPLILEIHGGPHGMYNVGFSYMWQNFAANGYVVLYTNPRGSTGYGSVFGNAINRAYPSVDYDDLMAGVDSVIGRGYIDSKNMFVSGCSGGGVLSSWVIGHTNRFAAAAVRCPVIDWLSFSGETDIPFFLKGFFEKPFWEDPQPWLKQSSLMYVGNVTTPTLLMTGVLDQRTPMPQTEEYFAALKMRGVPTAILRFEEEWHGTSSKPSNFMRTQLYMMSWFKKYGGMARPAAGSEP